MPALHIDFETYSCADLREVGLDNYAQNPTTGAWCMAYAFGDEDVGLWIEGQDCPALVRAHVEAGGEVVAHNAHFELAIWNKVLHARDESWPALKSEQCRCTMAMAYAMSLPGALENAAAALGLDVQKDMAGHRLMLQMCRPRSTEPLTWWNTPDRLERLYAYCKNDVVVERELEKRLLPLSPQEQKLWALDWRINNRGVQIDIKAAKAALQIVNVEKTRLNAEMKKATDGFVWACSNVQQLANWVRERGVDTAGVAKADIIDLLGSDNIPADVRAALLLRQEAAKTSNAKIDKMLLLASSDGKVRNTKQIYGANTGRWAARGVQTDNMPRPRADLRQPDIDHVLEIVTKRATPEARAAEIDMLYGPTGDALSSSLRGLLVASSGHDLIAPDFANVESRVLAWLAGEEWKLQAFREKKPIYEITASGIYRVDVADVTKDQRQVGKVAELACGFQGGVGAFQKMARAYNVEVSDAQANAAKIAWREAHPETVQYWSSLESAAIAAMRHDYVRLVISNNRAGGQPVAFRRKGSFLWCRLPSGRVLCYPYPKLVPKETPWGEIRDGLVYMSVNGVTRKWEETDTYGGKLAENITQAVARDLLAEAIARLEENGIPVVMHVHDEAIVEVPQKWEPVRGVQIVEKIMSVVPPWATGLPIVAEGWRGKRYRK